MTPTSRLRTRLMIGAIATALLASLLAATASAATVSQRKASITDATTGLSDASSVVPRSACGVPEPGHAACLAQFLVQRQTGQRVHPHLLPASSAPRLLRLRGNFSAAHAAALAAVTPPVPAPQPGSPAFLQQAYDVAALAQTLGGDQTIAIVDAYDAPNAELNMTTYRNQFGLPLCTSASGCFQKVNEFGRTDVMPSKPPTGKTGWQTEIALDLEAVSAICPHCKIELVESFTDGLRDLAAAQLSASKLTPTPNVITDSWGGVPASEKTQSAADSDQQWDQNTGTFTFPGIATVAASGDFGYLGAGQNAQCKNGLTQASCNVYPAALPGVTAAGGTTMVPANGTGTQAARGLSEVAWSGTGSGCDTTETKPAWQTDSGCTGRAYNDLSADGDPATGMSIYSKADGGWEIVAGTSLSSPLIAAYYALLNSASAAATTAAGGTAPAWAFNTSPSWAYNIASTLPNVFNDPSSGSNGTCDPLSVPAYICTATTGYDGPTGLGTISGAVIPGAPGLGAPGYGDIGDNDSSYTKTVTANSATLQGGVYPNGNDTTYFWQYGTTTAYGETTPNTDIGNSTAPVQISDTISGLAPNTTYHYRLVAVSPDTGTAYPGYDFAFTTSDSGNSVGSGGTGGGGSGGSGGTGSGGTGSGGSGGTGSGGGTTGGSGGGTTGGSGGGTTGSGGGGHVTHAPNAPTFGTLRIQALGSRTATVTELLNTGSANTTYYLAYGTTSKLTQRTASAASSKSGLVTWHLRGLRAGTVYYLQASATNAGGTRRTGTVRVKTSPLRVGKITANGNKLQIALRCRGTATCRVRLAVKVGKRTVASGRATVRGNHNATITLKLNRAAAAHAGHGKHPQATLSAVSVWNGYAATVAAKFRLALG